MDIGEIKIKDRTSLKRETVNFSADSAYHLEDLLYYKANHMCKISCFGISVSESDRSFSRASPAAKLKTNPM